MSEFDLVTPAVPKARNRLRITQVLWPAIGLAAVAFSLWLLVRELQGLSLHEVGAALRAISARGWVIAVLSTLLAYAALAWYDRIALAHLGFRLPWAFISTVSFTTYALSHNVGMSMFSGAMVRYRAYSTKGLTLADIGVLVGFCSLTFALGTGLLGGIVCLIDPGGVIANLFHLPAVTIQVAGFGMLALAGLYGLGSLLTLPPLRIGSFVLTYPRPAIMLRQFVAGPLELIGAAGIIYCALPAGDGVGFLVVLGVFLASFSAALLSHAPGGLGVLELVFVTALPQVPRADVVAALLVFRLLYLIAPLCFGIVAVILFERSRLVATRQS